MFKVGSGNIRKISEICSKLIIKTLKQCAGVSIIDTKQIKTGLGDGAILDTH